MDADLKNLEQSDIAGHRLLTQRELNFLVPMSRCQRLRLEQANPPMHPRRIYVTANRAYWRLTDILAWIDERQKAGISPHLRERRARLPTKSQVKQGSAKSSRS